MFQNVKVFFNVVLDGMLRHSQHLVKARERFQSWINAEKVEKRLEA